MRHVGFRTVHTYTSFQNVVPTLLTAVVEYILARTMWLEIKERELLFSHHNNYY